MVSPGHGNSVDDCSAANDTEFTEQMDNLSMQRINLEATEKVISLSFRDEKES